MILPAQLMGRQSVPPGDDQELYQRVLQVSGISEKGHSFLLRPVSFSDPDSSQHPWSRFRYNSSAPITKLPLATELFAYEPLLFNSLNTRLPRGINDGATWQGRGLNTSISAGLRVQSGPFVLNLRPQVGFSQNLNFDLGPYPVLRVGTEGEPVSEFTYRSNRAIDLVQRFGTDTHKWMDLGDSYAEIRGYGLAAGISNSRIWTGPGQFASLHYGYSAPGFLHARVGSYRPLETPAGSFEWMYLFGGIRKSDYFADVQHAIRYSMRMRSINSLALIYSPSFIKGLSVGALRTFIHPYPDSFSQYRVQAVSLFEAFSKKALGEDPEIGSGLNENQIASAFARWVFPDAGMEIYWEYGRNDHNVDLRDFRAQPNHLRAYILGFIKTEQLSSGRILAVGVELMQGETPRASLIRGGGALAGWYTHGGQPVGFTHRGQIMGSGYGPGSNYQILWGSLYTTRGKFGFKTGRVIYDNGRVDQYFESIQEVNKEEVERWPVRNVELFVGVESILFLNRGFEIKAAIEQSFIFNHHYIVKNDLPNTRFELTIRKRITGWLR